MNNEKIAYIAGLFDGEGCICIVNPKGTRWYRLTAVIGMCNPNALMMIQAEFGGSLKPRTVRKPWKQLWALQMSCRDSVRLIETIFPYLMVKKDEAALALQFAATFPALNNRKRVSAETISLRQEMKENLSALKRA